jgi:hypothetical protein
MTEGAFSSNASRRRLPWLARLAEGGLLCNVWIGGRPAPIQGTRLPGQTLVKLVRINCWEQFAHHTIVQYIYRISVISCLGSPSTTTRTKHLLLRMFTIFPSPITTVLPRFALTSSDPA